MLCPSPRCTSIWGGRRHLLNSCILFESWHLIKLLSSGWGRRITSVPSTSPRVCLHTHLLIPPTWTSHFSAHHTLWGSPLAFTHAVPLPGTPSCLPTSPVSFKRPKSNISSSSMRPFPASQAQHISSCELALCLVNSLPGAFIPLNCKFIHPAGLWAPQD